MSVLGGVRVPNLVQYKKNTVNIMFSGLHSRNFRSNSNSFSFLKVFRIKANPSIFLKDKNQREGRLASRTCVKT